MTIAEALAKRFPRIYDVNTLAALFARLPQRIYSLAEITFLYAEYKREHNQ